MPAVARILETALYVEDLEQASRFYQGVVGLQWMSGTDRLVSLHAGNGSVLLLFRRGATAEGATTPGGAIPPHHGSGPAHFAFAIDAGELDAWRLHLAAHGVEIESEVRWKRGGVSLYFRDPDDHSVELATPGVWPVY